MIENPHQRRVARAFAGAVAYDEQADVQRIVAEDLASRIVALGVASHPRILELGCGTGFLSGALAARMGSADWTISDIAPEMVERARQSLPIEAEYRVIDGEQVGADLGRFDLICASLAFQWFADLPGAIARLGDRLAPGGLLAFSTMAGGSFGEWRAAHEGEGFVPATPDYPNADALRAMASAGLSAEIEIVDVVRVEDDARAFLSGLKAIGARTPRAGSRPLAPGALRRVMAAFDRGDRRITYRIAFCLFRKGAEG